MARVVGQIIHRPGRVTVLWSEGAAALEPYHLEGPARDALYDLARRGRERLAQATANPAGDHWRDLAQLGHQLYRLLFQLDSQDAAAQAAHAWWQGLNARNAITSLELATDMPGRIPWNIVYDGSVDGGHVDDSAFWGLRYSMAVGRRVSPHRVFPNFQDPVVLVALDPAVEAELPNELRGELDAWTRGVGCETVRSFADLTERLRKESPDLLVVLSRVERGQIVMGEERGDLRQIAEAIRATEAGNPQPLVLLLGSAAPETVASWECFLGSAASEVSSVIVPETPGAASANVRAGLRWLNAFLTGTSDAASALRQVRQELGIAGMALNAFCPPYLRVLRDGVEPAPDVPAPVLYELPEQPYRPLAPFDREDRALFTGREEETVRFARLLDEAGTRGVFLHGGPGVGKASLLRAGVLPYLEDEGLGYLAWRDRSNGGQTQAERDYPTLALRPGGDLAGQLAEALTAFCAQPFSYATPTGGTVSIDLPGILQRHVRGTSASPLADAIQAPPASPMPDSSAITTDPGTGAMVPPPIGDRAVSPADLWQALEADPGALARLLDEVTSKLPHELVLVVEQGEDLLTQVEAPGDAERRARALQMLHELAASPARCKVIISMRTEFLGKLLDLLPSVKDRSGFRDYLLAPLSRTAIKEALLLPMATESPVYAASAPHAKYRIAFAAGVIDEIVNDALTTSAEQRVEAAPLAQAGCAFLADRAREQKRPQVTAKDLRELRSVKGSAGAGLGSRLAGLFGGGKPSRLDQMLDRYVERQVNNLPVPGNAQLELRRLFDKLYVQHADGSVTRTLAPARALAKSWKARASLEESVNAASDARLFEVQRLLVGGQEGMYVSLGPDSLAGWSARQAILEERRKHARSRVTDVLFLLVPLIALAAALTYFIMNSRLTEQSREQEQQLAAIAPEMNALRSLGKKAPAALYAGALAQAEQALAAGNLLRARQHLLTQLPFAKMREEQSDHREFAWHYLWRRANPERHVLEGHKGIVYAVAASPDGNLIATAGLDGSVRLWNLKRKGEVAAILTAGPKAVLAVAFSPDGKRLASAGEDAIVHIWDVRVGEDQPVTMEKASKQLAGHEAGQPIQAIAFGKDADTVISGSGDKTVIVWDIAGGKTKATLKDHTAPVAAAASTPDGASFATADAEGAIHLYDADGAKKTNTLKVGGAVNGLAFSADGVTLAAAVDETVGGASVGVVRQWDAKSGKEMGRPLHVSTGVFGVAFKGKSTTLVVAGKDNAVRAFDTKTGQEQLVLRGHMGWVRSVAVTPDGQAVASSGYDNSVKVWNWTSPSDVLTQGDWVQALAFSNDDQLLASGGKDGVVKLWRVATGEMLQEIKDHPGPITSLAFVPNVKERKLIVGSWNEKGKDVVKAWDIVQALGKTVVKEGPKFEGHTKGVTCLAIGPENTLATGGADGTVHLWDPATGKLRKKIEVQAPVECLAFSPAGKRLAVGDRLGAVRAIDITSGKRIVQAAEGREGVVDKAIPHNGAVHALAFFTEDFGFMTGGEDHVVMMWTWKQTVAPSMISRAHHQPISAIVRVGEFTFASAGWDGTIKLFDLHDAGAGEECFTFRGHTGPVRALAVTSNRKILATGSHDGTIRLWRAGPPAAEEK